MEDSEHFHNQMMTDSGLTSFEVSGLQTAFNFADGHAYHDMPKALLPVTNRIKFIWKEAVSKSVPEMEERFKRAVSRIIRSPILGNHRYYSLCPTASNSVDIAAAWLYAKKYNVGLIEPAFDNLYLLLKRRDVKVTAIQEGELRNLKALARKVEQHSIKSLFIVSPNNPTGFQLKAADFSQLAEFCSKRSIVLIIDKSFRLYSRDNYDEYQILTNNKTEYIVIEDTGKTWPTQETKVSLIAYSEGLAGEIRCLYEEVYLCHSKFSLNFLSHLIEKTHEATVKKIIWSEIDKRKSKVDEVLLNTSLKVIRGDDCCPLPLEWIDCSETGLTDLELVAKLEKFGVAVLPGRYFYWNSPKNHTQKIRISLLRSTAMFDKGLDSLRYAVLAV